MSALSLPTQPGEARPPTAWRLLALCICLSLALIGANLIYNDLAGAAIPLGSGSGDLIYLSSFSAFNDDWDLFAGSQRAQVVDEQLEITVSDARRAAWSSASPIFADFDLSARAIAHAGPVDNGFGIIFHAQFPDEEACNLPAITLCGLSDLVPLAGAALRQILDPPQAASYTAFLISSDGYYSLWRNEAGSSKALSAWIPSAAIKQGIGAENKLRIIALGADYQFHINGARVQLCLPDERDAASTYAGGKCLGGSMQDSYRDSAVRSGRIGLLAQSTATGGGGVAARFDDVIVRMPGAWNAEEARL